MEIKDHISYKPKSRTAALRQAGATLIIVNSNEERKKNLMNHSSKLKEKISKLELELVNLEKSQEKLDIDSKTYKELVEDLKLQYEITDLDIQEARLDLLRRNLAKQEMLLKSGIKEAGSRNLEVDDIELED